MNDIDRALEDRQRNGTKKHPYGINRPTHREVIHILATAPWSAVVVEGKGGVATVYEFREEAEDGAKERH